jgi:hypothetical protein
MRQMTANLLPLLVAFCRLYFGPVFSSTIWLGDGVYKKKSDFQIPESPPPIRFEPMYEIR